MSVFLQVAQVSFRFLCIVHIRSTKFDVTLFSPHFISYFSSFNLSDLQSDNLIHKDTKENNVLDTRAVIYVVKYTATVVYHVTNAIIVHTHKRLHTSTVICAHFHHDGLTIFAHTCELNIKLYNRISSSTRTQTLQNGSNGCSLYICNRNLHSYECGSMKICDE